MLYCTKCQTAFEEGGNKCPVCHREKSVRVANDSDYIRLHRADLYTAQRLAADFDAHHVAYRLEPYENQRISHLYDSEVMPTDQNIFVRYSDLTQAKACSARLKKTIEDTEEFDDMPPKKRLAVQIISVILFLLLVTVVVLCADSFAGWLLDLFQ